MFRRVFNDFFEVGIEGMGVVAALELLKDQRIGKGFLGSEVALVEVLEEVKRFFYGLVDFESIGIPVVDPGTGFIVPFGPGDLQRGRYGMISSTLSPVYVNTDMDFMTVIFRCAIPPIPDRCIGWHFHCLKIVHGKHKWKRNWKHKCRYFPGFDGRCKNEKTRYNSVL